MCITGKPLDKEDKVKGDIEIPNLSDENEVDEVDVCPTYTHTHTPSPPHSHSLIPTHTHIASTSLTR